MIFKRWLQHAVKVDTSRMAVEAWNRIQANPKTVIFYNDSGYAYDPQSVRIEPSSFMPREQIPMSGVGASYVKTVVIFGVKGHPNVPDTYVRRGMRFVLGDDEYQVIDVLDLPGELQVTAEAVS